MAGEEGAILLAEDRVDDVPLIEEAFQRARIPNRLLVLRSGKDVIDYLDGHGQYGDRARWPIPSLLLLDLEPPQLDAFEVLQWMRKQAAFDRVIAVVLTVGHETQNVDRAYEVGANSFLAKPKNLDTLAEVCLSVVDFWLKHNIPAGLQ
jgi:CheY-like chemotaxis protein